MIFIDRKNEMAFLNEKWKQAGAQMIVLWGKRRVGKTELVKQFMKNKLHIYYLAESTHEKEQLKRFSYAVNAFFKEPLLQTRGFLEWEECFKFLKEKNKKIVLAIDEFPYLISSNPGIVSLFQKAWDEYWKDSRIFLILLGSSISMMETEVLGYRAPLYGRRTGQWKLQPLSFSAASQFRKGKSFEDAMMHYAVAGGVPEYLLRFSLKKNFYQNIKDNVIKKGEMLYDEVEFLLREELREPRYYFALLQAIAQGKRKLSEIVNATGIIQSSANKYLTVLADLDIIEREVPVTEPKPLKSKKGLYRLKDEFFRFWFSFVFPNRARIEMGHADEVIAIIKQNISLHMACVYEKVAMETLRGNMDLSYSFDLLGRWWDKNDEIDIVGINKDRKLMLFGEVKWSNKPVGINILRQLKQKAEKVSWGKTNLTKQYVLFSKNGFTEEMLSVARNEKVILFKGVTPLF